MAQDITLQAQAMTTQVEQENPPSSTMANRLRDFTKMKPPVYTGSMISKNLEEECRVYMMHASMGISRLMVHVQQVGKKIGRGSTLGQGTGQGNMRRIFQGKVELKSGICLAL